jgi:cellulose synthase A
VCDHFAVAGKELETEREMEGSMEWKERIDKWKTKQEKRGKLNRDNSDDEDDDKNDDEYML